MQTTSELPPTSPSAAAEASAAKARPAPSNRPLIKRANEPSASQRPGTDAPQRLKPDIDRLRARHLSLNERLIGSGSSARRVTVDEAESPLVWLARRRGRDGRALIDAHQLQAGERLRADFTSGQMMPRTTANWSSGVKDKRRVPSRGSTDITDAALAARQRVNTALEAVGPEFSGLLLDLCCFLKRLEDIEQARRWPARSAKVVLQLALDRLARHYGYSAEARGKPNARISTWLAEDASFRVD